MCGREERGKIDGKKYPNAAPGQRNSHELPCWECHAQKLLRLA